MEKEKPNPDTEPKTKRVRPPRLVFYAPPELMAALEDYKSSQDLPTTDSEVLRKALLEFLKNNGAWPRKKAGQEKGSKQQDNGHP